MSNWTPATSVFVEAGLSRYHHNIETSRRFYAQIVTTHDFQERVNTVAAAKAALWKKGLAKWGQDGARIKKLRDNVDLGQERRVRLIGGQPLARLGGRVEKPGLVAHPRRVRLANVPRAPGAEKQQKDQCKMQGAKIKIAESPPCGDVYGRIMIRPYLNFNV